MQQQQNATTKCNNKMQQQNATTKDATTKDATTKCNNKMQQQKMQQNAISCVTVQSIKSYPSSSKNEIQKKKKKKNNKQAFMLEN
jgi:hypothetical protein